MGGPIGILHLGKYYPPEPGGMEVVVKSFAEATAGRLDNYCLVASKVGPTRVESSGGATVHYLKERGTILLTPILPSLPLGSPPSPEGAALPGDPAPLPEPHGGRRLGPVAPLPAKDGEDRPLAPRGRPPRGGVEEGPVLPVPTGRRVPFPPDRRIRGRHPPSRSLFRHVPPVRRPHRHHPVRDPRSVVRGFRCGPIVRGEDPQGNGGRLPALRGPARPVQRAGNAPAGRGPDPVQDRHHRHRAARCGPPEGDRGEGIGREGSPSRQSGRPPPVLPRVRLLRPAIRHRARGVRDRPDRGDGGSGSPWSAATFRAG